MRRSWRPPDELFYRRGFEHTSFAVIAEQVGISRGSFYLHFKSTDEILAAAIEARQVATRGVLMNLPAVVGRPVRLNAFGDDAFVEREVARMNQRPANNARPCGDEGSN